MIRLSVAIFFVLDVSAALANDASGQVNYKNCFVEDASKSCESQTIDIDGTRYGCVNSIDFDSKIKKISFIESNVKDEQFISVLSGDTFYTIGDGFKVTNKIKASRVENYKECSYIVDKRGNAFKVEGGAVYVIGKKGIERRINVPLYDGEVDRLVVGLAIDNATNQLIISTSQDLLKLDLNNLKSLEAKQITPKDVKVTGFALHEGFTKMVLGLDINGKFKIVEISAVPKNYTCSKKKPEDLDDDYYYY